MMGQGFGILLEMWKVTKTVNIRIQRKNGLIPYTVIFEDKHALTETEADTQKYYKIAFVHSPAIVLMVQTYMYWGGIPLLLAYAAYSLYYEEHKSWYSYIITTLVGFVYAWGFLMMVFLPTDNLLTIGSCTIYQLSTSFSSTYASSCNDL